MIMQLTIFSIYFCSHFYASVQSFIAALSTNWNGAYELGECTVREGEFYIKFYMEYYTNELSRLTNERSEFDSQAEWRHVDSLLYPCPAFTRQ